MSPPVDSAPFDLARYQDPLTIQRVLHTAKTVAIVGLSSNQLRPSNFVGYYLKRHGYRVIPVNPRETEVLGEQSLDSLTDLTELVDIVVVFRAPDALPGIAAETVEIGAATLWCQFGVINEDGARIALRLAKTPPQAAPQACRRRSAVRKGREQTTQTLGIDLTRGLIGYRPSRS